MQSVGNRAIAVDGKVYDVTKTTVKKPGVFTFAPVKGEAVYVDGKKYYVEKAPDFMANDKTKDVVYINGKEYDVTSTQTAYLKAGAQQLTNHIFDNKA